MTAGAKLGAEVLGYPHAGCFAERVWICLIAKELTFLVTTKSPQEIGDEGDRSVRERLTIGRSEDLTVGRSGIGTELRREASANGEGNGLVRDDHDLFY